MIEKADTTLCKSLKGMLKTVDYNGGVPTSAAGSNEHKTECMLGFMIATLKDRTELKLATTSSEGIEIFQRPSGQGDHFNPTLGDGFVFVSNPAIGEPIYDLSTGIITKQTYTTNCTAQKMLCHLGKYLKQPENKGKEVTGLAMREVWHISPTHPRENRNYSTYENAPSCEHCIPVIISATERKKN